MTGTRQVNRIQRTTATRRDTVELGPKMRELAHRESPDIDVSLFWQPNENSCLLLLVEIATGVVFEIPVPAGNALDAFNHPYTYLPAATADDSWTELLAA